MLKGYFTHFGVLDVLIVLAGLTVLCVACYGGRLLRQDGLAAPTKTRAQSKERWMARQRVMSVVTDLLPLAGLLGTALAILNTFLGLDSSIDPAQVIANFAPGLTTTISGIGFAMLNTFVLQAYFNPALEKRFG